MKTNVAKKKTAPVYTHEGAVASRTPNDTVALRRAVMACMLFEDQFYESGVSIADRIKELVPKVPAAAVANFAIKAREDMKLRHVPLLLVREMARGPVEHKLLVKSTLERIIQRADELSEFLAIYWKEGKQPISAQVKKGLAKAFMKFNAYALAKYNRDAEIELRDVAFLTRVKAGDDQVKGTVLAKLVNKTFYPEKTKGSGFEVKKTYKLRDFEKLETPDTWEVELSAGADKRETFERLINEDKLGALALLRNLRNMEQSGVDRGLIKVALEKMDISRVLPFRFIAAARAVPKMEDIIEPAMLRCAEQMPKLKGKTVLVIDVSGSMDGKISGKSDLMRVDAACGLAIAARELCEEIEILTFSGGVVQVPPRRGFALRDAIVKSQPHGSTYLGAAVDAANRIACDRIIVITDEQSADQVGKPRGKGYMINVASYQHGVGYGDWTKIDGFSEAVLRYMAEYEAEAEA